MIALWALLIAMQSVARGEPAKSLPTLSVCDVLADDPTRLSGKVIRVRGLLGGSDEGTWLSAECESHLVTKGLTWGSDLSVYVDVSDENIARSWERERKKLKGLHADWAHDKIWATIVGRLETRASMDDEVVQMPYGLARAGFGHLGGSPAEINVISVEDVTVERPPVHKTQ
jgi:hypothetical protein